jgi:chromosome partitioning protein
MSRPYVVTISSEKGGVGKTTLATNLAIYLKAINEDLPVTLFSFDNHFSVDRMFRLGRSAPQGNVLKMLTEKTLSGFVEMGEYGVQFIPSSGDLWSIRDQIRNPKRLARILAGSELPGILIIDTRPDLDTFTQNALFAADRVVVPVKDAPSLENCKHLYDFFERQGLPRRTIRVLPCLVDQRIHFDGPFRDSYQLLKAYAINRGYRCLEGFISKSPKVEALNTNPEGKIYPVITHGRGTEVHVQFAHLARQVYLETLERNPLRLDQVAEEIGRRRLTREESFSDRRAHMQTNCLLCGKPLISAEAIEPVGYYCENADGSAAGLLEDC